MRLHQLTLVFLLIAFSFTVVLEMRLSINESLELEQRELERCISESVKRAGENLKNQMIQGSYSQKKIEEDFFFTLAAGFGIEEQIGSRERLEPLIPVLCIITEETFDIGFFESTQDGDFKRIWTGKITMDRDTFIKSLEEQINLFFIRIQEEKNSPVEWILNLPEAGGNEWVKVIEKPCVLAFYIRNAYGHKKVVSGIYGASMHETEYFHVINKDGILTWHYSDCPELTEYYREQGDDGQVCFDSVKECAWYGAHASECCEFLSVDRRKQ